MNKNIIFGIGATTIGFVLGVITDRMATATKTVEEMAEITEITQRTVDTAKEIIDDQSHTIDLLSNTIKEQNNTIKEQNKKYKELKEIVKNYLALEKVNELAEEVEKEKQEKIEKVKEAIKNKKWDEVYHLTERWYNHYPVQMSRSEVFTNLETDGYITQEERTEAYNYFGSLWNYVGD